MNAEIDIQHLMHMRRHFEETVSRLELIEAAGDLSSSQIHLKIEASDFVRVIDEALYPDETNQGE